MLRSRRVTLRLFAQRLIMRMIVQAVIEQSGAFAAVIDALLMTSAPLPLQIVRHLHNYPRFANRFNQIDKAFCEARPPCRTHPPQARRPLQWTATARPQPLPPRLLPDSWIAMPHAEWRCCARSCACCRPPSRCKIDQGDFLLVNDAAAIQFNASADQFNRPDPQSHFLVQALTHRRATALDLLQSGRSAVFEERVNSERDRRVFLTTHRPVAYR